jgi:hypothetical protein
VQTYVPWDPTLYYDNLLGHAIPLRRWSELVASHIAKGWMKIPEPPASNTSSSSPAGTTTNATATSTPAPASGGGAAAQPQVASGAGNLTINNGTSQTFSPANRRHRSSSRRALHSWWSDFWGSGSEEEDGSGTSGGRDAGFQGAEEGDAVAGFWRDIHAPGTEICCNKQDNADWVDFGSCSPVVRGWMGGWGQKSGSMHATHLLPACLQRTCPEQETGQLCPITQLRQAHP